MVTTAQKKIFVYAHWQGLSQSVLMGFLFVTPSRGQEIFSFEYAADWLSHPEARVLDPNLKLYSGRQYVPGAKTNFGLFLDSSPDRWGRFLMQRREAIDARTQSRNEKKLLESDFLLGVFDAQRMGGLRFKLDDQGPFLNDLSAMAVPPWASLRELEQASFRIQKASSSAGVSDAKWINMLLAPGGSLGGARPKAGVVDEKNRLWIAKFPALHDSADIGAWEYVLHVLAKEAGVCVPQAIARVFSDKRHTFLTKRFDRMAKQQRLHFASAMTLLERHEGDDATTGVSYLELADFIVRNGVDVSRDLEEMWRRIVFFICVSNTDDHLRNHGFLLLRRGWKLSPAYDMNPVPHSQGLKLNISENDNSLDLDLARSVAVHFRVKRERAETIIKSVIQAARQWRKAAKALKISARAQDEMAGAFAVVEKG